MVASEDTEDPSDKKGIRLPHWVWEWVVKLVPWAFMAVVVAGANLYSDNIGNKRDISAHAWRLEQLEGRSGRCEARLDRNEEAIADLNNTQAEFHPEVIARLSELLDIANKKRKQ